MSVTDDEAKKVGEAMRRYGGGFVRQLGIAVGFADPTNRTRIKNAFPEYWSKYLELSNRSVSL